MVLVRSVSPCAVASIENGNLYNGSIPMENASVVDALVTLTAKCNNGYELETEAQTQCNGSSGVWTVAPKCRGMYMSYVEPRTLPIKAQI